MKKLRRKLKRSNKFARYSYYFLTIFYLVGFVFFAKNIFSLVGIETLLRIILIIFFFLWLLLYVFINLLNLLRRKYKALIITSIITFIFIIIFAIGSYVISTVYGEINNITEDDKIVYTTYLIKLKNNDFDKNSNIGRISNENDTEGYALTKKLIVKENLNNKIEAYEEYAEMIQDLYDKEVGAIFVSSNYVSLFSSIEGFENIASETEIIYEYSEKMKNQDNVVTSNKDFSDPLTFLIMGVDSEKKGLNANAAFNGDTLMLVAINPNTLDVTMVSIPRDTYVPITCNNDKYAKINSAAAYGTNCVLDTVSSFLNTKIDYYVKINFKGVVDLVDALGGVEVDVEKPDFNSYLGQNFNGKMCEQNSDRQIGSKLVCVDPGLQVLNGEQALAYARNRHLYIGGDLDRVVHQQQVVEAIAKKLLNFGSLTDFQNILSAISNNIATNMSTSKILSGYKVIKNMALNALSGEEFININKAYLETYSLPVVLPNGRSTSALGYYNDSLEDIQNSIKEVLELKEKEVVKTFEFSVNEEYVVKYAGQGKRSEKILSLMPNLIGSSVSKAEEFCDSNNISLSVEYVNPGDEHYNSDVAPGLIGDQSILIGALLNDVKKLTIYVVNSSISSNVENKSEEDNVETKENNDSGNEIDQAILDSIN